VNGFLRSAHGSGEAVVRVLAGIDRGSMYVCKWIFRLGQLEVQVHMQDALRRRGREQRTGGIGQRM
jgi:hypothetical protein